MSKTVIITGGSKGIGAATAILFAEKGYIAEKATAVDMFPRTHHVETVVCLKKG